VTRFRVYIEETTTRMFYTTVAAATPAEAQAFAEAALADDSWLDWPHSEDHAEGEHRDDLTEPL